MNISKKIAFSAAAFLVSGSLVGGSFIPSKSASAAPAAEEIVFAKDIDQVKLTYRNDPSNSIVVNWRDTADVKSGKVQVTSKKDREKFEHCGNGSDEVCQEVNVESEQLQTQDRGTYSFFHAEVTDLKPGQEYFYRIFDGKGWSPTYSFKTADKKARDFTMVAGGELHIGDKYQPGLKTMAEQIQAVNPAFMLSVGDQVDTGYKEAEWERFFNTSPSLFGNVPFMPAVGNHETYGSATSGIPSPIYKANFTLPQNGTDQSGRNYSFDYNGVHVAVLEANPTTNSDYFKSEVEWLKQDLASAVKRTKFQMVITHSPLFHSKTSRVQPKYENPEYRDLLVPVMDQYGVDMVMSGHDKHYVRSYPLNGQTQPDGSIPQMGYEKVGQGQGTVYMELSTTGENYADFLQQDWMEVGKQSVAAFLSMDVKKDRIEAKAIQADGSVLDQFTILPVPAK